MTWRLSWSAVAEGDLRRLHWRVAARVDEAVMLFAAGAPTTAKVERRSPTDPSRLRLRLPEASALLWVDLDRREIYVIRVLTNK